MAVAPHIGLLNEKPLHASLRAWCARPGDRFEVPVDGFVIDIVRGDRLIEIQTGSFAAIKPKLASLVPSHPVRLIHPVAGRKWIVRLPTGYGREIGRRRSPKRGRVEDVFAELVSIPQLIAHPNFSLEVVLIEEEEVRRYDGKRGWRRHGWVVEERRLLDVIDRRSFEGPADWRALLPATIGETLTARELAEATGVGLRLAQQMVYCLRKGKVIRLAGKEGRAHRYASIE